MRIISILFYVLIFYSVVYGMKGTANSDKTGLTVDNANATKGILAISILLSHMTGLTSIHLPVFSFSAMGSIGVGAFFFMSGYGLIKASHYEGYFDSFLYKHALKILVPYMLLLVFWICLINGVLGNSFIEFLNSYKIGDPVSHSWYVFACLYTYFLFWVSYRNYTRSSILKIFVGVAMWIAFFSVCIKWPDWWYKTICCFVIGIIWGTNIDRIEEFIKDHFHHVLFVAIVLLTVSYISPKFLNTLVTGSSLWLINDIFMGISGAMLCGVALQRLSLINPITIFMGRISYCFYLFHGLTLKFYEILVEKMIGYKMIDLPHLWQELVSCMCLLTSIGIAWAMYLLSNRMLSSANKRLLNKQ